MPVVPRSSVRFALVLWLSVLALTLLGPDRATLLPASIAYSTGFAALWALWRSNADVIGHPGRMLALAVILRMTIFPALPDLSDDIYRYLWDGWLTASGVNPFRYAPSDEALARFQDSGLFGALNSPDYHSIYPPLSQLVFALAGLVYRDAGFLVAAYVLKAIFAAMELTGLALLTLASIRFGLGARVVALYALNPLTLVALTAGAHSESGLVLGLGVLAWALSSGRPTFSWIGLVLASAVKGIPLLFAPLLVRHRIAQGDGWPRAIGSALPAAVLGTAMLIPFYFDGFVAAVGSSAELYVRRFEFNPGLYRVLEGIGFVLTGTDQGYVLGPLLRFCFLVVTVWIWVRWRLPDARSVLTGCLAITGLYLVTATTVHPWYLVWGLALVPFATRMRAPWLFASWAAFGTYFVYVGAPAWIPGTVFWSGAGLLVLVDAERGLRDRLLRLAGRRKARQIEPHLQGGLVLDLGCGEGYVSAALARRGHRPILLDVGPYARVNLPSVVYDGRNIPFRDGSVDTVFMSLALHHASDPDRVLREALRVARSRLVVTESTYEWEWERRLLTLADRFANRMRGDPTGSGVGPADVPGQPEPLHFRTVAEWKATFRLEGVEVIRSERLNRLGHRHHLFVLSTGGETGAP